MVLLKSLVLPMDSKAPDFNLPGIDGQSHSLNDYSAANVLVIIFMCNHCPYIQAVIDRLVALDSEFNGRGVQIVGINSNDMENYPEDDVEHMKAFAEQHNIKFPYLVDESQEVAKAYQAQCTPDIFVFNGARELAYHGRIDDNWQEEAKVTTRDLANAIENLLNGQPVQDVQHPSMGCSIKWK